VFISDQYVSYLWKIMADTGFEPKRVWTWKKPAAVPFNRHVNPVSGCEYILWGIKPGGKRTFNSDTDLNSIVDRYAVADKVSSIVYREVKDGLGNRSLDAIFADAKKEAEAMISSRKQSNGKVQAIIPNTITYSGGLGKDKIHPTQKPTEILEYFIELCTNPGDLVLDTFAGSGSTGIAAKNTGRDCILIERDAKMFAKMSERFVDKSNPAQSHPTLFVETD
jgi:DNA modification methylase